VREFIAQLIGPAFLYQLQGEFSAVCNSRKSRLAAISLANSLGVFSPRARRGRLSLYSARQVSTICWASVKGKSAIHLARVYGERKRNFVGQHFWARGYFVSSVGGNEEAVREYIQKPEQEDKRLDQMGLW
jgi:putative transposase